MVDYTEGSGKQYHTGIGPEDIGRYVIFISNILLTHVKRVYILGRIAVFNQVTVYGICVTPHLRYALIRVELHAGSKDEGVYCLLLTATVIKEQIPAMAITVATP